MVFQDNPVVAESFILMESKEEIFVFVFKKSQKQRLLMVLLLSVVLVIGACSKKESKSPTSPQNASELLGTITTSWVPESAGSSTPSTSSTPTQVELPENVILSESLTDGSTVGAVYDGTLTGVGLQLHGIDGFIRYAIPTTASGYIEFNASGFLQDELHGGSEFKAAVVTMWSGDDGYDYRTSGYIFEVRKFGYISGRPDASNAVTVRVKSNGIWEEGHFHVLSWDPGITYRIRVEWQAGQAAVLRDDVVVATSAYVDPFAPSNHQIQIGAQVYGSKKGPANLLISDVVIGVL